MQDRSLSTLSAQSIEINKVLRNTYMLLSMSLLFSAAATGLAMFFNAPPMKWYIMLIGYFGLLFLTTSLRNSAWGLLSTFAFTGFMGYTLGPVIQLYLQTYTNGGQLVMTALGGTGLIFMGLSAYTLVTRKDFSYMRSFLFIGVLIAFFAGIASIIFKMPLLNLMVSGAFMIISSGYILFTTSQIIHGGERNYIMATIMLYVSLFNLFISLLNILGAVSGRR